MTQKNNIDGILLLDKPTMMSSNQAIQRIKKKFNINKLGHTGTLDPLATGLLPVCMGRATRVSQFLIDSDKTYQATIRLGIKTSTGDKEGEIIEKAPYDIPNAGSKIGEILESFIGKQNQIPPMFSALKHKGQRLYKLAAKGIDIQRKPRSIHIHSIHLISFESDCLELIIECSKGTYIRTLAEDIAAKLNTVGHIDQLRRSNIKCFNEQSMFTLEKIISSEIIEPFLLPMDTPLKHFIKTKVSESESSMFSNGLSISKNLNSIDGDHYIRVYDAKSIFLGLAQYSDGFLKPKMVFNNTN